MKIKFENGSKIISIENSDTNGRGKRSELISFCCKYCDCIHVDYPIKDITIIDGSIYCNKILEIQ